MSPLYTYWCENCTKELEVLASAKARPEVISCEECAGPARYKISGANFTVNGANAANNYSGESNFKWISEKPKK